MADIKLMEAGTYNTKLAHALKESGDFAKPDWINFVKTGAGKMRPIEDVDFWYKRAASILRQFYIRGIVGVGRLRTRYGNRKDRGMQPARFYKASGKIIKTSNTTQSAIGNKDGLWTTVLAAAVFVPPPSQ